MRGNGNADWQGGIGYNRHAAVKLALALGGGAGLGWAHIGVLRALNARGVGIAAVSGTSIGALAAACVAADRLDVLEELARGVNWRGMMGYIDFGFGRGSVLGGKRIARELRLHFGDAELDQLTMPCAVVATDLVSGRECVMTTGPVVDGVSASIALPGIFPPVRRDGMVLVDGGMTTPVPVRAVRALSDAPVLAVNLQGDYLRRSLLGLGEAVRAPSTYQVGRTAISLLMAELARKALVIDPPDFELAPPIGHVDLQNFTRADELIAIGAATVDAQWSHMSALIA